MSVTDSDKVEFKMYTHIDTHTHAHTRACIPFYQFILTEYICSLISVTISHSNIPTLIFSSLLILSVLYTNVQICFIIIYVRYFVFNGLMFDRTSFIDENF